jgi:hypothetical protein
MIVCPADGYQGDCVIIAKAGQVKLPNSAVTAVLSN